MVYTIFPLNMSRKELFEMVNRSKVLNYLLQQINIDFIPILPVKDEITNKFVKFKNAQTKEEYIAIHYKIRVSPKNINWFEPFEFDRVIPKDSSEYFNQIKEEIKWMLKEDAERYIDNLAKEELDKLIGKNYI